MTTNITTSAMLIRLSQKMPTFRRSDKKRTAETAEHYDASAEMVSFSRTAIAQSATGGVTLALSRCKAFHLENTLPWLDNGLRILPAANYWAYSDTMRALRAEVDRAKTDFIRHLDRHQREAKTKLGELYNAADYPTAGELDALIGCNIHIMPLPDGADFRVGLTTLEADAIRSEINTARDRAVNEANRDLWLRLHTIISDTHERLSSYGGITPTGKVSTFRDSVITNLEPFAKLLGRLNVTNDPELEAMRMQIVTKLANAEPEVLRNSDQAREAAIRETENMLDAMRGYIGADVRVAA